MDLTTRARGGQERVSRQAQNVQASTSQGQSRTGVSKHTLFEALTPMHTLNLEQKIHEVCTERVISRTGEKEGLAEKVRRRDIPLNLYFGI